jgi:hypothetical protein
MDYTSIFGELTQSVQARIDAASRHGKQIFDRAIYPQYLDWDRPTVGLNFEELIGEYNITVAAATVGDNSKEPELNTEGISTIKQKVFNHAISRPLPINEYRTILGLLDSKKLSNRQMRRELVNILWGSVEEVVNSVQSKIDMIFLSGLSNCGVFEFDEHTNPKGGVRGRVDFNQPSNNILTVNTPWTEQNINDVDPFEDLSEMLDKADETISVSKLLISPAKLSYIMRAPKMRQAVFGNGHSSSPLTLSALNNFMESNDLPVFEKIRRKCRVSDTSGSGIISPWVNGNIVAVPAGKIGVIKNAYCNNELRPEPGVSYSNYGRIRISEWGVGETQGMNGAEYTKAESLSLPVITAIKGIFTLRTEIGQ